LRQNVYPGSSSHPGSGEGGWYTFSDFLKEIEKIPRIEEMFEEFPNAKKALRKGSFA
jgi:hypothetical protein